MCVCVHVGVGGSRAETWLVVKEQEKGAGSGQVWRRCPRPFIQRWDGWMKERGKEELRGLVGWRRWGSPTAMTHKHTGTDTKNRERAQVGLVMWRLQFMLSSSSRLHICFIISGPPRVNSCTYIETRCLHSHKQPPMIMR